MSNPLTHVIRRISEALVHRTALFLTTTEKVMGVSPDVSFKTMSSVYLGDLAARASIDFLADQITGAGFYTTMNSDYVERSDGKTAKEIVDEFCADQGLDKVLQESARYVVGWGKVFWWVGSTKKIDFLRPVPLEIIRDNGVKFDADGRLDRIELDWKRQPNAILGDEELHSDNEYLLRAKALHEHLCNPSEYIRVVSDVIDFGTAPILAGDRIWVTLPNENVDGYYRVASVEYRLIAETQTLETTLELGREPPLLADYLYALRSKTGSLSRYKVGRV